MVKELRLQHLKGLKNAAFVKDQAKLNVVSVTVVVGKNNAMNKAISTRLNPDQILN